MAARSKTTVNTKRYIELYNAYLEIGDTSKVAQKMGTSKSLIGRLCHRDRWEEKRLRVLDDVRTFIGEEKPKQIIETLSNIETIKNILLTALKAGYPSSKAASAGDYDKMVRLEQFLQGEPDSRPDTSITLTQVIQKLEGKTDEELIEFIKNAQRRTNRFIGNGRN